LAVAAGGISTLFKYTGGLGSFRNVKVRYVDFDFPRLKPALKYKSVLLEAGGDSKDIIMTSQDDGIIGKCAYCDVWCLWEV
jgi:hypothetical protein